MCSIACVFIFWVLYFSVCCRSFFSNVNLRGNTVLLDLRLTVETLYKVYILLQNKIITVSLLFLLVEKFS